MVKTNIVAKDLSLDDLTLFLTSFEEVDKVHKFDYDPSLFNQQTIDRIKKGIADARIVRIDISKKTDLLFLIMSPYYSETQTLVNVSLGFNLGSKDYNNYGSDFLYSLVGQYDRTISELFKINELV